MLTNKRIWITILLLGFLVAVAAACEAAPTEPPLPIETRVAQTLQALETPVTPAPTDTRAPTDTPAPTETPAPTNTPAPTDTPEPTHTAITLATATPSSTAPPGTPATAPPTGGQVFFDNFSSELGWYVNDGQNATFEFIDGGYQITNKIISGQFWSVRSVQPLDTIQEVDAWRRSGPEDGYYGLVCRHQEDGKNYYLLVIGSDGFYGIGIMEDGVLTFLIQGIDTQDRIDQDEDAWNRVRGDCDGDRLALYANGFFLVDTTDTTFQSGMLGMFNGTRDEPDLVVLFDNYAVAVPLPSE